MKQQVLMDNSEGDSAETLVVGDTTFSSIFNFINDFIFSIRLRGGLEVDSP